MTVFSRIAAALLVSGFTASPRAAGTPKGNPRPSPGFRRAGLTAAVLLLGIGGSHLVRSQNQPAQDPQTPTGRYEVTVDRVNLLVTASDNKGRFVTDLAEQEFQVFEDGKLQQITNFSKQTNLPLNLAFLLDTSSSVAVKLPFEKEAATNFIYSIMRDQDKALLAEFDSGVTLLQDFTSSPNEIVKKIAKLRAAGGTALYDAIYEVATKKMQSLPNRKVIVVLSDGADTNSRATLDDVIEAVRLAEVAVYGISTSDYGASGDHGGDKALKKLAEETGGKIFFPYSASQLEENFDVLNQELRSQYNIAYESANKKADSSFRSISVKTSRDDVRLRHRRGYRARAAAD
jgi:Ca-activated chloride channel family protein